MTTVVEYLLTVALTIADTLAEHYGVTDMSALLLICGVFVFCGVLLALDAVFKCVVYTYSLIGSVFFGGLTRR